MVLVQDQEKEKKISIIIEIFSMFDKIYIVVGCDTYERDIL